MRSKIFTFMLAVLVLSVTASAQKLSRQDEAMLLDFDRHMSSQFKSDGPGAAVLVAKNGNVIYKKA